MRRKSSAAPSAPRAHHVVAGAPAVDASLLAQPWALVDHLRPVLTALAFGHAVVPEHAPAQIEATVHAALGSGGMESTENGPGVAVIPLCGVITPTTSWISMIFGGGYGLDVFTEIFERAIDDDSVSAILLDVDSPGGSSAMVPETAAIIAAARGTKPIIAIANGMCASAAYWLASQADEVIATPSALVGSIGTYMIHRDWSGWNEQMGVIPTYVSAGKYKTDSNPDSPLSDSGRATMQAIVDEFNDMFVAGVADGRGATPEAVQNGYGEGRVLTATAAQDANLIDGIATFEDTLERMLTSSAARHLSNSRGAQANVPSFHTLRADVPAAAALDALPAAPAPAAPAPAAAAADDDEDEDDELPPDPDTSPDGDPDDPEPDDGDGDDEDDEDETPKSNAHRAIALAFPTRRL